MDGDPCVKSQMLRGRYYSTINCQITEWLDKMTEKVTPLLLKGNTFKRFVLFNIGEMAFGTTNSAGCW